MPDTPTDNGTSPNMNVNHLTTAGLFAGIAGIERGLEAAGHRTELFCEIYEPAQAVLTAHYPDVPQVADVKDIKTLPKVDLVSAGFPCQDLSQAGTTAGIAGQRSGLVGEVFRLIENPKKSPGWLLLENVPFMLRLDRGKAMHYLTDVLDSMGFMWAYRIIDARSFGIPQRRRRVVLLASRVHDPREILFNGSKSPPALSETDETAYGFYWTEGLRGLGWGESCVPTLKAGSSVGIPSPPAIWMPDGRIGTPDIRDAERLQGFPTDWTVPGLTIPKTREGTRWRLVGNAVSVSLSSWVGEQLGAPSSFEGGEEDVLQDGGSWPTAAWGFNGRAYKADLTEWPRAIPMVPLAEFLNHDLKPLSKRAASGFLSRARRGNLRFVDGFLDGMERHLEMVDQDA